MNKHHTILAVVVPSGNIIAELTVVAESVESAKAAIWRGAYLNGSYWANGRNIRLFTGNQLLAWRDRRNRAARGRNSK